jgi:4-diphosphocytidyl-2-C-methyl-D-erythritol kinase
METIMETARAKINLTLPVLFRREDGYHEIDSLMHTISLCDTIEIEKSDEMKLEISEGTAPAGRENLMWRAAEIFFSETKLRGACAMSLYKKIPSEAGLGGGSSDAAAVLRGLNRLYGAPLSADALSNLGARLGADVPFCLTGGAARCRGIGEKLTPVTPWPHISLLIVRPHTSVSTKEAYAEIDKRNISGENTTEEAIRALAERNFEKLSASLANDFEPALFPINPILAETSKELRASYSALMTGSGSAFFVLVSGEERKNLAEKLRERHRDWYVEECETAGD